VKYFKTHIKNILKKIHRYLFAERHIIVDECNVVAEYLNSNGNNILVDIGAMKGSCTDLFYPNQWTCFTIECNPVLVEFLTKKYRNISNVKIINKAIYNQNTNKKLYTSTESLGITSIVDFHETHKYRYDVEAITFTRLLELEKISKIDFLKIDIEGADYFVLIDESFEVIKPRVVLVEFEFNKIKKLDLSVKNIIDTFLKLDYFTYVFEWYPINKYGTYHDFNKFYKYTNQNLDNNSWGNILAFSEQPDEDYLNKIVKKNTKKVF